MAEPSQSRSSKPPPFAPLAIDEDGKTTICCEACGSTNIELDGWDIDKCRDCGHWRYREGS